MVNGEWTREVKDLDICVLDISKYPVSVKVKQTKNVEIKNTEGVTVKKLTKVKPCVEDMLKQQLTGGGGHIARIAVARSYINAGLRDPLQLAQLFKGQNDFNESYTIYQIQSILDKDLPNVSCETLQTQCSQFIDCSNCKFNKIEVKV